MEQAIMSSEPILAGIKKTQGEAPAIAMLELLISDFVKFFTVGKGMNRDQIIETAKLFYTEFYYLKLSDIKLFFSQMKTGHYGVIYDRIDGNVIFTHLRTYCEERINCAEKLSLEKHKQLMALDGEDKYIISIIYKQDRRDSFPPDYIMQEAKEFILIQDRIIATKYVFSEAISTKQFLLKNFELHEGVSIKIERPIKEFQSIIEFLKAKYPEDMRKEIREDKLVELKLAKSLIENNPDLSPFEKRNVLNKLYGFKPMTLAEFENEQKELISK